MSKEKMICKHWKTCEEYFCIRHKPHRCGNIGDGHICNPADWKRDKCNSKCIPYIPEQEYECTADWNRANCLDKLTCPTKSDGYLCHYWQPKKPVEPTCHKPLKEIPFGYPQRNPPLKFPADLQPVLEEQILKIISEYLVCISHMPAREPTQAIMQAIAASSVIKFPTWEQATDEIEDSRFKENRLQTDKETILVRSGARIMYDRLYSMMLSQGCKV